MQEFPERTAHASSDEGEIPASPPPLEWYVGYGGLASGISIVTYSSKLMGKEGGEIGRQLEGWQHYTSNNPNSGTKDRIARAHQTITEAEDFIKGRIGYSPQELNTRRAELTREYHGRQEAPFEIELF